jgi:hypothetical protein
MFQEAVLLHNSRHLAYPFSQRLCKLNLAVKELQVTLELGKQMSRRGFFRRQYDVFNVQCTWLTNRKADHELQWQLLLLSTSQAPAARRT